MIPKKDNLIGYWKLNGAIDKNGLVKDFSGRGNEATVTGTEKFTTSSYGNIVEDFSSSQYITLSEKQDFIQQTGIFTLAFTEKKVGTGLERAIYALAGSPINGWRTQHPDNTSIDFYIRNGGTDIASFIWTRLDDLTTKEFFIVFVGDGTGVTLYIDGEIISRKTYNSTSFGGTQGQLTTISSKNTQFQGSISNVMVWDTALTATEIRELYNTNKNPPKISPPIDDLNDSTILFSTRDGVRDLTGTISLSNTNAILGNGITTNGTSYVVLDNNPVNTSDAPITIKVVFDTPTAYPCDLLRSGDGLIRVESNYIKTYPDSSTGQTTTISNLIIGRKNVLIWTQNGTTSQIFLNGIAYSANTTQTPDWSGSWIIGTFSGSSGFIGTIHNMAIYNEIKTVDWVKEDYEKESKYF